MNKIFDIDNPVWSFFGKLLYAFEVSLLWTITSIPIFTIGASNAAMYYVLLKVMDEREVKIFRDYFKAFKENFKKATLVWVPLLFVMILGVVDIYICFVVGGIIGKVGSVVFMCAEVVFMLFSIYVFPLMGRFENTLKQTIKNGFLMPLKHFIITIWIIIVATIVVVVAYIFPPISLFLPGVMAFTISYPLYCAFKKYTPEEVDPVEERMKKSMPKVQREVKKPVKKGKKAMF